MIHDLILSSHLVLLSEGEIVKIRDVIVRCFSSIFRAGCNSLGVDKIGMEYGMIGFQNSLFAF